MSSGRRRRTTPGKDPTAHAHPDDRRLPSAANSAHLRNAALPIPRLTAASLPDGEAQIVLEMRVVGLARVAARSGAASGCHPPCEYLALAPIWKWSADNGCPHPASMRIVATTMNAAVKIVSGLRVTAFPDDATYLVVAEGGFVLQEAPDRGARPALAGQWACLMIKPHLSRVSSLVLPAR